MRLFSLLSIISFLLAVPFPASAQIEPAPSLVKPAEEPTLPEVTVASPDAASATRSAALELVGAFANDGYKVRDGYWFQELSADKPSVLEVNLFAGNEYWFCAAIHTPGRRIAISVFDESGRIVDQQSYTDGPRGAAGFEPVISGRYFVRVSLAEGDPAPFTLVYSYK